jgi:predicted nucleic acid-binding protein
MVVSGNYPVVLDACVLAPITLCDLLLKLAETPRLYLPRFSKAILDEVKQTQIDKLNWPVELAEYWRTEVARNFPEALVENYEPHIAHCTNQEKDKHVLAVAIHCQCGVIITSNLKDFPKESLDPWQVRAVNPSSFLISLYEVKHVIVISKIDDMAVHRKKSREDILRSLYKSVPGFASRLAAELQVDLAAQTAD